MTRATVHEIDGQLVLEDPDALAVIKALAKFNCRKTFELQADRVAHFARRIVERGALPDDLAIVLLNVDDVPLLADMLMPNSSSAWQAMRDAGQIPFARGLVDRAALHELVAQLDPEAGAKMTTAAVAVVVMDHGVIEIFEAQT